MSRASVGQGSVGTDLNRVVAVTTDIPLLTNWGKPLLFGPGSILDAHTAGEKISKSELLSAVDTYKQLVQRLKANGS